MSLLQISGLHKRYGTVAALDGVSLEIAAGSRTAVVGPSGSGKTTLLRLIAGFDVPDAGRISMDGQVLADGGAALPAHRRGIGVVAQDGALFPHLTIADNIGFGLGKDADRAGRIQTLMAMVELDGAMADRKPDQLSGGQQQRVALARALARQPQLILLDEPFSALDTGLRAATRKAVADVLGAAGVTTVLVTHDQAEALSFADQVAVMRDGRLVQVGDPRAVYRRPVDAVTAEFLGDAVILTARISGGLADCALGRIAVDDSRFKGDADILLRPEQILLATAVAGGTGSPVQADIVAVDFCGSTCDLDVRLVDHRPEPFRPATGRPQAQTVKLRQSSHMMITTGMLMDISISGPAHILEG